MPAPFDYSGWTEAELGRARLIAQDFLSTNHLQIHEALAAQCRILSGLIESLNSSRLQFEDRLDCLAHIAEVSQMLRESAEGFFTLGSQLVVAQTLADAER